MTSSRTPILSGLFLAVLLLAGLVPAGAAAATAYPVEPFARYQPQTHCAPRARPGTVFLEHWTVRHFGGRAGGISRACRAGGTSEHKEGRAFDWTLDARTARDRARARAFLARVLAADVNGRRAAMARRMGIMYVIWSDHIYASYDQFRPRRYLASSCPSRRRCTRTLRHRDHLHVSLTRLGGRGSTSFYAHRMPGAHYVASPQRRPGLLAGRA